MFNVAFFQNQVYYLSGSGVTIGDTSVTIDSLVDIYGNLVTMSYFGNKGWFTSEQGTPNERQQSFTGLTQNGDGTATLTGVKTVFIAQPYTETTGFDASHAGGTSIVFSNNPGLYQTFANKENEGTVKATWTFNAFTDGANPKIDSNSYVFQPLDYITTGGVSSLIINGTFDYFVDSGSLNTIVITPSPALSAYAAGQHFFIKVAHTNTGTTTINVNGLGAETLKKEATVDLSAGDILAGEVILVCYDGTNFQLVGGAGSGSGGSGIVTRSAIGSFSLTNGVTELIDTQGTSGSTAGNVMAGSGSITSLYINTTSNSLSGDTVYTLLKNGTPTSVTITVPGSTNGIFHDTSHVFSISGGDLITLQCDSTASVSGSADVSFSYQVGANSTIFPIQPSIQSFLFDDFIGGSLKMPVSSTPVSYTNTIGELGWTIIGNITRSSFDINHPGVVTLTGTIGGPGTLLLGNSVSGSSAETYASLQTPNLTMEFLVQLSNTSNSTSFGFGEGNTTSPRITIESSGGVWAGVFANASTTFTTSTTPATTTNWVKLKLVTDATGANVEFFVDGVSIGTLATTTTPGYSNFSAFMTCETTGEDALVDYYWSNQALTR